jgi:nitric oxide reductase large subunit
MIGGAVAHYRADAASFYGFDISGIFPSQLLRTWHLQLAILWIATGLALMPGARKTCASTVFSTSSRCFIDA